MIFNFALWHFNSLDFMLAFILGFTVIRGCWIGFSRSAASLFGVLLGFWAGMTYLSFLSEKLAPFIKEELIRSFVSFLLIFLIVYMAFTIIGIVIKGLLKTLHLTWADRAMGALVGLIKGLVLTGAIIFLLTVFLPPQSHILKNSALYPELSQISQALCTIVPENLKGRFMWKWRHMHNGSNVNGLEV